MATDSAQKVYTRGGDKGQTSLIGGKRVSKSHLRLEAYGTLDELNCVIGVLSVEVAADLGRGFAGESSTVVKELRTIQNDLFNLGSRLACEDAALSAKLPALGSDRIPCLEKEMDRFSDELKPLKNFILPGGSRSSAQAHIARTVCRRAERLCVTLGSPHSESEVEPALVDPTVISFLNRLSDYFFVLARHLNRLLAVDEPVWKGQASQ